MPDTISVCMIVRDEEQLVANCLASVRGLADEVVVVDTGSRDRTKEVARGLGSRVIRHEWDGNYGRARNVYLRAARGEWVLVLDGDEALSPRDHARVRRLVRRGSIAGYRLTVRNYTDDFDLSWRWHPNDGSYPEEEHLSACPGWVKTQPLRLFRRLPRVRYSTRASSHTSPIDSLSKHAGRIEDREDVAIHHFQHLKGGGRFISHKQRLRLGDEILHVKKHPRDPYHYLNVAKTLFAERRDAEAADYLARAVKLDDSFHDAYQLWGMLELENGKLDEAERHLREALRVDPKSADAWAILGMVLAEAGRPADGARALRRALRIRPRHLLAHNSLGVALEDLGRYQEARREYQAALELHPRFGPARANLARLARADGGAGRAKGE